MKNKIISTILVLAMLLGTVLCFPQSIAAAEGDGLTFGDASYLYVSDKKFETSPLTIEAWIKLPKDYSARAGVIIGNYGKGHPSFALEIHQDGKPRLYWQVDSTKGQEKIADLTFSNVHVNTGEWVHLVVVRDKASDTAICYVDGEAKQTLSLSYGSTDIVGDYQFQIGGDLRSNNSQNFKGAIKGVATYSTVLSASQVTSNYNASKPVVGSLICYYDISSATANTNVIDDLSGNGYHIRKYAPSFTFEKDYYYEADKPVDETPNTFEAWIKLPAGLEERPGVIFSNYGNASAPSISFEINTGGKPRLYWTPPYGSAFNVEFSSVDVRTGGWVHLVIVRDKANSKAYCYVNGVKQDNEVTLSGVGLDDIIPTEGFIVGGDYRYATSEGFNDKYFKGEIKAVAAYSAVLDAATIKSNYDNGAPASSKLFHYDFTKTAVGNKTVKDLGSKGYDLTKHSSNPWMDADDPDKEAVKDFDYTFVVVGDTQTLNDDYRTDRKDSNGVYFNEKFHLVYDWIINNKEKEKIEFVMGVGDITENNNYDSEWTRAMTQILRLKAAGIPFSLARGNHDAADAFEKYYSYNEYKDTVSGAYNGSMLNTYQKFTIGNRNYLIMALDCGPTDAMLAWAEEVIEANPDYNVIITTHSYLYRDGTTHDSGDIWPVSPNNGEDMWQKLVSKHSNIALVINGHDPASRIITNQTAGENGNIVTSLLVDGQYDDTNYQGVGLIALLHFSEDSDEIQIEYVSTVKDKYFRPCNQFTIELDLQEIDPVTCNHSYVNGYCSVCGAWDGETIKILGANVSLNNSFKINYYANIPAAHKNAQMKFTMNGKTYTVDPVYLAASEMYVFTFANIPPQCIGDSINAELISGGEVIASVDGYSILKNAQNTLTNYSHDEKLVTLVKSMLGYGAATQQYANYKTDALVNAGNEIALLAPDGTVSVRGVKNNTGDQVFSAAGVYFDSVNKLYVKVKSDTKPTVTVNGTAALVEEYGDGVWIVFTDGIFVIDFDVTYTFVITSNANKPSFTYSVNSYTYAKRTSENAATVELAKATYTYGVAAKDYIAKDTDFNGAAGSLNSSTTVGDGWTFATSDKYLQNSVLPVTPNTFEAWIYLPSNCPNRVGCIIGSYNAGGGTVSLEIGSSSVALKPRLYWTAIDSATNKLSVHDIIFDYTLQRETWYHLVVTRDQASGNAYCYVNGKQVASIGLDTVSKSDLFSTAKFWLGGDYRSGNSQNFKGITKKVALYSEALTAEQVASNYKNATPGDYDTLLCYYDLSYVAKGVAQIPDLSGNGYTFIKN